LVLFIFVGVGVCVGGFDIITSTIMHSIVISEVNMVYSVLWTAFISWQLRRAGQSPDASPPPGTWTSRTSQCGPRKVFGPKVRSRIYYLVQVILRSSFCSHISLLLDLIFRVCVPYPHTLATLRIIVGQLRDLTGYKVRLGDNATDYFPLMLSSLCQERALFERLPMSYAIRCR